MIDLKKGFAVSFWAVTIGIASAIIGIFILGAAIGNFWSTIGQSENVQTAVSATRLFQAAELVSYVPSSGYTVDMDREYENIDVGDGKITFYGGDEPMEVDFFRNIDAAFEDVSRICVRNEGTLDLQKGSCSLGRCDTPLCIERNGFGMVCRERMLDTQNYYTGFFEGCGEPEESFVSLDYMECPDRAEAGAIMSCSAGITYRCSEGSLDATTGIGGDTEEHELKCTGSIEHRVLMDTAAATADGQLFRVDIVGEGVSQELEVRPG